MIFIIRRSLRITGVGDKHDNEGQLIHMGRENDSLLMMASSVFFHFWFASSQRRIKWVPNLAR